MHLDNGTPFAAAFTSALDSDGREHVVVVVKGSFSFTDSQEETCTVSTEQTQPFTADSFWGEPGVSAPKTEMDFAHFKARCDILLEASAHAPHGRPVSQIKAGVAVGSWSKTLDIHGDRVWLASVGAPSISDARPFLTMPITYDLAFGGVDRTDPDDDPPYAYQHNPVGRGWHRVENVARLNGAQLPNIEYPNDIVSTPWGNTRPAGLGPVGRGWPDRLRYAGTYDDAWTGNTFPFLPRDFDPRYYQASPEDQQVPYPKGGERVVLANLTPDERTSFKLPDLDMPMLFSRKRAEDVAIAAPLDTLVIQPEARRLTMTWRASLALVRDIFEVQECIIGKRSAGFWRARRLGKTYFSSFGEMVGGSKLPEPVE